MYCATCAAADKTIRIYDTEKKTIVSLIDAHSSGVNDISWLHSDKSQPVIVSAADDRTINVSDASKVIHLPHCFE